MVPRTVAIALMAASLGSCAPQPRAAQGQAEVPLTPGPRFVALAMAKDSTPGFSGTCYLENRTVMFSFRGYSGPNRLCTASCAFVDGGGAVQTATTGPAGIRPTTASPGTEDFGAAADRNGPSAAAAVRLVEGSGSGSCQRLF